MEGSLVEPCSCMATKHPLAWNCLFCGNILCEAEDNPFCTACGAPKGKTRDELRNNGTPIDDDMVAKALAHRDKLLSFQSTSAQRTKVLDDQGDWFDSSVAWLSNEEVEAKAEAKRKKEQEERENRNKILFELDVQSGLIRDIRYEAEKAMQEKFLSQIREKNKKVSLSDLSSDQSLGQSQDGKASTKASNSIADGKAGNNDNTTSSEPSANAYTVGSSVNLDANLKVKYMNSVLSTAPAATGTGMFANPTLTGLGVEVYKHILGLSKPEKPVSAPRSKGKGKKKPTAVAN